MARDHGCTNPTHKGHRLFVGGPRDGEITHLTVNTPKDFPQTIGSVLRRGTRSWYEIDYDASEGSVVVYRFLGMGREFPGPREQADHGA
jgi:hypothetical protein